jgi:MFS family permease
VLLIYPTVVISLEALYQRSYSDLIALSTAAFVAFGVFSLPAGWLADHWSRRNMMALFYLGCGLSLAGAACAPSPTMLAVALFTLGVVAAIYHPVGMAMLIEISQARGRTLARRVHRAGGGLHRHRDRLSRPGARRPPFNRQPQVGRRCGTLDARCGDHVRPLHHHLAR